MSKKLDQELADAIGGSTEEDAPSSTPGLEKPLTAVPLPPRGSRSVGLLAALLVMVAGLVSLFMLGFKEAAVYATPVDTLVGAGVKPEYVGRKVRVEGELVPGTLQKRDDPCEYRFTVHGKDAAVKMDVRYPQCVIPDTFRDVPAGGVQVTVEGALTQKGDFEASLVMAKCASKYDPKEHKMRGPTASR